MIENKIDNEAKKLLSDDLTSADSEKEVKNWFIISIVVSVVAVSKVHNGMIEFLKENSIMIL